MAEGAQLGEFPGQLFGKRLSRQSLIGFLGSFGFVFLEFPFVFNSLLGSFVNKTSFSSLVFALPSPCSLLLHCGHAAGVPELSQASLHKPKLV